MNEINNDLMILSELHSKIDNLRTGFNSDVAELHEKSNRINNKINELEKLIIEFQASVGNLVSRLPDMINHAINDSIETHEKKCNAKTEAKDKEKTTQKTEKLKNRTSIIIALLGVISTIIAVILTKKL